MTIHKDYVIEGCRPNGKFGIVSRMVGENTAYKHDDAKIKAIAEDKLIGWQHTANDREGYFSGWQFRIGRR